MSKYSKDLCEDYEPKTNWRLLSLLIALVVVMVLFLSTFTSCTSKHIQKSSVKTDSVSVKKVDSSRIKAVTLAKERAAKKVQVKKDNTKKTEKVKETTTIIFDNSDTAKISPSNGTAEDYAPTRKIAKIIHTKTTTKQVDNNTIDSTDFTMINKEDSTYMDSIYHSATDSTHLVSDIKTVDRKVFRFNWWWLLLLLIPGGWYVYKKYMV